MRLYLSARYGSAEEMRQLARTLRAAGHEITSRWIYPACPESSNPNSVQAAQWAAEDLSDLILADVVVHFAELAGTPGADGGGRFVEFGYALGRGVPCVVVGAGNCIFYRLPGVICIDDAKHLDDVFALMNLPAPGAPSPNPAPKPAHVPGAGASFSD